MIEKQCQETTLSGNFRASRCSRKAVVNGRWCRQHDPAAVAQRRAASEAKWRAESAEQDRQRNLAAAREAFRDACVEAVKFVASNGCISLYDAKAATLEALKKEPKP